MARRGPTNVVALAWEELHFVLERGWYKFGQTMDPEGFTGAQAIATTVRIARGNFRVIDRIFIQVRRGGRRSCRHAGRGPGWFLRCGVLP